MNYFKKVFLKYENRGIGYVIHYFLKKVGYKTKYSSFIHKKKSYLDNIIFKLNNGVIKNGIYKSLKLSKEQHWNVGNDTDLSSKLLGFYEEQVQKKIVELKKKYNLNYLVNFGAAEGYHAIGLIKNNYFQKCLCFEIDSKTRKILYDNIILNKVEDKIKIYNEANFNDVIINLDEKQLEQTLFLVDIEGNEFRLFNKKNFNFFKKSFHIIENHEDIFRDKKLVSEFYEIMNENFKNEILHNNARNPFGIEELQYLPDDVRWLLMSEGRPCEMNWLIFTPQK